MTFHLSKMEMMRKIIVGIELSDLRPQLTDFVLGRETRCHTGQTFASSLVSRLKDSLLVAGLEKT